MFSFMLSICLAVFSIISLTAAQLAQGGGAGVVATSVIAVQFPTVVVGPSLFTNAAGTSAVQLPFTQTFKSPLGTWAYPTPAVGSIGLGSIQGTVGAVRAKGS